MGLEALERAVDEHTGRPTLGRAPGGTCPSRRARGPVSIRPGPPRAAAGPGTSGAREAHSDRLRSNPSASPTALPSQVTRSTCGSRVSPTFPSASCVATGLTRTTWLPESRQALTPSGNRNRKRSEPGDSRQTGAVPSRGAAEAPFGGERVDQRLDAIAAPELDEALVVPAHESQPRGRLGARPRDGHRRPGRRPRGPVRRRSRPGARRSRRRKRRGASSRSPCSFVIDARTSYRPSPSRSETTSGPPGTIRTADWYWSSFSPTTTFQSVLAWDRPSCRTASSPGMCGLIMTSEGCGSAGESFTEAMARHVRADHRRVSRRELLPAVLGVEGPECFMADHDHLHGAVGIEVVEEHERRVEVAGAGLDGSGSGVDRGRSRS